jgi:hypothetical protein
VEILDAVRKQPLRYPGNQALPLVVIETVEKRSIHPDFSAAFFFAAAFFDRTSALFAAAFLAIVERSSDLTRFSTKQDVNVEDSICSAPARRNFWVGRKPVPEHCG